MGVASIYSARQGLNMVLTYACKQYSICMTLQQAKFHAQETFMTLSFNKLQMFPGTFCY